MYKLKSFNFLSIAFTIKKNNLTIHGQFLFTEWINFVQK